MGHKLSQAALGLTIASAVAPLCSTAASQILLGASFVTLLLAREKLRLPPIVLPLMLFFIGTVASLLLSGHALAGLPQIRKFYVVFLALLCFATAVRRVATVLHLVLWWAAAATCSALWGFVQFGQRYMTAKSSGVSLYNELVWHRITGLMGHWTTFAEQLMIVLLMLGAFLLFSPRRGVRWGLVAGSAAVISLGLILAFTRGPWLGFAAGLTYLLWRWQWKSLLALPVLAVLSFLLAPSAVRERVISIVRPHSMFDSGKDRIILWRTGLEMVKAHPWFGVGPEQVDAQFDRWVPADIPRPLPWGWYRHMHNIYVQYAAERGIPVLLMLLWLVGKVMWDFSRGAARQPSGPGDAKVVLHGCVAAIIAVMVAGLFDHNLGQSNVLQVFLTLIAAGYVAAKPVLSPATGQPA